MGSEEKQRKGIKQAQGRSLARQADLQGAEPGPAAQHAERGADRQLAQPEDGDQPPGNDPPDRQRHDGGHDVQPVRGRIEDLAEPAGLVQRARDLAIQPVG